MLFKIFQFAQEENKYYQSLENGGHLLAPEIGVTVDAAESFGLQLGVPFTVIGKNSLKHWGVHFSMAYSFGVN